jgi:hypothetical protein
MVEWWEDSSEEESGDSGDDSDEDEGGGGEIDIDNVKKIIRTFHNDDCDVEFDDALSSDRSILQSTTRATQWSYNKPDNWVERNSIGIEKVKRALLTCIDSMKNNARFKLDLNHIRVGRDQRLMNNEESIVWHEPILDRYWDVLEAEIDRMRQLDRVADVKQIQIMNIEMKKERLAALVAIFRSGRANNSSTFVNFDNANLCAGGIISLSELVDVSSELQALVIMNNRIDGMDSARCLSRSLLSHARINQLCLKHCDLGSSPEILSVILQSDMRIIDLSHNNIDSLGAVKIAEYLEGNQSLSTIVLAHNHLNDNDAILISQALKKNKSLYIITLHTNNFTSTGVKALLTCVFDSSSLNALSESNHMLGAINMFLKGYNETNDRLQGCIDNLLRLNRTEKILLALQDKDSLLGYLANLPLNLIPEVLAFSEWDYYLCPFIEVNIVYYTMRWWNMPMLYSYHSCVKSDTKRKRDD